MPEMTPQEAAEKLEYVAENGSTIGADCVGVMRASKVAISCLRKVAAGELKPVVHCDECIYGSDCKRYVNIVADADSIRPVTFCSAGIRKP